MSAVDDPPRIAQRLLAAVWGVAFSWYGFLVLLGQVRRGVDMLGMAIGLPVALAAALCWWYALRGHRTGSRALMRYTVICGAIIGGIGFVAGFIGPMIVTPSANQGPLLGIFFTGPLGFVAGALGGLVYGLSARGRGTGRLT